MASQESDQGRVPILVAFCAVVASSLLRLPWVALVLIMPHTASGAVIFYLVVASAGIVLLHWCLSWFSWTMSLGAALLARAAPGLVAAAFAGVVGFHASVRAVVGLAVLELIWATFVVGLTATRPEGWAERGTGFEPGQLLPVARYEHEYETETDSWSGLLADHTESGAVSLESVVRAARDARLTSR